MKGTVVLDLDGVIYLGDQAVPGAGDALFRIARMGLHILFCTNNSFRTRKETAAKIETITGFPAAPEQVLSSAAAASNLMAGKVASAFVVGGVGIAEALADNDIRTVGDWRSADAVVVGVDFEFTYQKLEYAVSAVRNGALLVATNTDATYPTPDGLAPGAGTMVAAIERGSGVRASVAGKPEAPMRALILKRLDGGVVWVVGDRPETDLAMANAEGWGSVLVLTGVVNDPEGVVPEPDLVAASIVDVPQLISAF